MNGNPEEKIVPTPWPKGWVPPLQDRTENTWRLVMGYLLVSLVMMPILLKISLQDVPPIQEMLAYALFCICTWPVVWHFSRRQPGLPVFPIVCLVYAVSLALPVFYAEPILSVVDSLGTIRVMDNDTTRAVQYSILGVLSLQFGFVIFRYSIVNLLIPRLRLELDQKKGQTLMILLGLFGLVLTSFTITGRLLIPTRYLAATTLLGRVSILSTSFLYVQFLRGRLDHTGKMFLLGILLMNVSLGLGLGAVRSALDPMLAIGAVHWMIKRRISWKIAFIAMVFFVIMQAVKGQFRTLIYSQAVEERGSVVGRLEIWQQLAHTVVSRLMVENKQATATSVRNSFGRMDMIHIFGHAIDETPRHVPFQEGKTYSYFLYMFVPRALWPAKPTAQAGNEFFGLAYGLQAESSIGTTSIGLPHIVEAYINFGSLGVVFVMMILGMVYATLDRIFNHEEAGAGGVAIYATILFSLVNIETCTTAAFGATLQTIVFYALLLRTVRARGVVA